MRRMFVGWSIVWACGCGPAVPDDGGAQSGTDGTTAASSTSPSTTSPSTTSPSTVTSAAETVPPDTGDVDEGWHPDLWGGDESGDCATWATMGCASLDEPNAFGTAVTPIGELQPFYSYFGAQTWCGGCVEPNVMGIYFLSSPADTVDIGSGPPDDSLWLELSWGEPFTGPLGAPQPATSLVAYGVGTEVAVEGATFVLESIPDVEYLAEPFDPFDAIGVEGTLDLENEEWSVHLSFVTRFCPDANGWAICE